jgi:hypothetical protein
MVAPAKRKCNTYNLVYTSTRRVGYCLTLEHEAHRFWDGGNAVEQRRSKDAPNGQSRFHGDDYS